MCGGTPGPSPPPTQKRGLSPRVRGNHIRQARAHTRRRSIPACAGEPLPPRRQRVSGGVYPRVCGGTQQAGYGVRSGQGLSPRVRGNPGRGSSARSRRGSIPACAGEPSPACSTNRLTAVYPRVCGGTGFRRRGTGGVGGLSPRVRGNRRYNRRPPRAPGSIPACAGEPQLRVLLR